MKIFHTVCVLCAAFVLAAGTAQAQTPASIKDISHDVGVVPFKPVDDIYQRFANAYRGGDASVFLDLYSEDALYLPAAAPTILRGKAEIQQGFAQFFKSIKESKNRVEISFQILDRIASGDLVSDVGIFTLWIVKEDGERDKFRGKFVVVARKDKDGQWRFHVDSFSDLPPDDPTKP